MKKRNELVILEELKLKPPKIRWSCQYEPEQTPHETELKKLIIYIFIKILLTRM